MQAVSLNELLICCGDKAKIIISHRNNDTEKWEKTTGNCSDSKIQQWKECEVVACKWEKGKPLQIAVEGIPNGCN